MSRLDLRKIVNNNAFSFGFSEKNADSSERTFCPDDLVMEISLHFEFSCDCHKCKKNSDKIGNTEEISKHNLISDI